MDKIISERHEHGPNYAAAVAHAISRRSLPELQYFIGRIPGGANASMGNCIGHCTPLMFAAEVGSTKEIMQALIDRGAKINQTNRIGWTALDFANFFNKASSASFLVSNGARANYGPGDKDEMKRQLESESNRELQQLAEEMDSGPAPSSVPFVTGTTATPIVQKPIAGTNSAAKCGPGQTYQGTCGEYCAQRGFSAGNYANSPRCTPSETVCVCSTRK
ncbi:ankyrin repeat domain-containing protein [Variovorax sp. SRS16]|uniref:ankyrin repeat domain-containing protein n=1 Tax=Variovorax sp. SRS16 TaxID=282217 RepID=UPI003FCD9D75